MEFIENHILEDIKKLHKKCEELKPLVTVRCVTFNHAKYIKEALDGFLMQKTDFPFVVIVHDDASKDGTSQIILDYAKRYPDLIFPLIEKENLYSKKKGLITELMAEVMDATGAEFIAMCEGDDYWTDPLKLQKQVDFLRQNPDFGLCYTSFDIKDEKTGNYRKDLFSIAPDIFPPEYKSAGEFIVKQGYVCPPSWVLRRALWKRNLPVSLDGTFVRFTDLLINSKVKMLPDVTCVYREVAESASHSNDYEKMYRRQKNLLQTQLKLIDYYRLPETLKETCKENYYRRHLKNFIVYSKHEDVKEAKKIISSKTRLERLLFLADRFRLNPVLKMLKKLKN